MEAIPMGCMVIKGNDFTLTQWDCSVLKTNNKKYYSNKKIHAYEASIYTKENETFGSDHLLHQADSLLLSYHGAKWEAKGVLS